MSSDPIVGRSFGPYRVVSALGKGGMGEVYVASDDRLHRRVALKLLPEDASADAQRKARFLAEARAVSALQHPNIVTIFDVGSDGGRDWFAMELVDGEPLRSMLRRGALAIDRAVRIAADVAAAIDAAHARGIIHRDLKPENIVVTPKGDAKVLDYGLAKVVGAGALSVEASTVHAFTEKGAIVGTVAYMSPEQADGRTIDHRTDIFSLGVVLYEMLTGRQPFAGKSNVDTLHRIINADPPPVREINRSIPDDLLAILEKALAKDPAWRYAAAADMRLDLLRVGRSAGAATAATPRRNRYVVPLLAACLAITAGALAWVAWKSVTSEPTRPADIRLQPFTNDEGYEGEPTFSADGRTIAYVSDRNGNLEIYLRQISGGPDVNITNDPADDVQPAFSPDGKEIAFVSSRSSTQLLYVNPGAPLTGGDIWVTPALGGMPRRIARGNFPSWSPDGRSIVFTRGPWGDQRVYRVDARGGAESEIPVRFPEKPLYLFHPRFSPDTRWLMIEGQDDLVFVVPASGGDAVLVARGRSPAWDPGGDRIVYSNAEPDRNYALWEADFDPKKGTIGEARPLTVSRGRDVQIAIAPDGRTIAFAAQDVSFNIERIAFDAEAGVVKGEPEPLTGGAQLNYFFAPSPDGSSIVYQSLAAGAIHLWRKDLGRPAVQLTNEPGARDRFPAWSPDGSAIAFVRKTADDSSIFVMKPDGANPRSIGKSAGFVCWTPDGRGIAYTAGREVRVIDVETRLVRTLTSGASVRTYQRFSADGKWLLYAVDGVDGSNDVRALSLDDGQHVIVTATPVHDFHPFFSPSGRWVYVGTDHKNLLRIPGPGQGWRKETPKQVTFFPESNLFIEDPQITPDGRWLYYARGRFASDIWLLREGDESGDDPQN